MEQLRLGLSAAALTGSVYGGDTLTVNFADLLTGHINLFWFITILGGLNLSIPFFWDNALFWIQLRVKFLAKAKLFCENLWRYKMSLLTCVLSFSFEGNPSLAWTLKFNFTCFPFVWVLLLWSSLFADGVGECLTVNDYQWQSITANIQRNTLLARYKSLVSRDVDDDGGKWPGDDHYYEWPALCVCAVTNVNTTEQLYYQ